VLCALLPPNREPVSHVIRGPKSLGQVTYQRIRNEIQAFEAKAKTQKFKS